MKLLAPQQTDYDQFHDQLNQIDCILDEINGNLVTQILQETHENHPFHDQNKQTFLRERYDLFHMYLNFPFLS